MDPEQTKNPEAGPEDPTDFPPDDEGQYGALLDLELAEFEGAPVALPPEALNTGVSALSTPLPPRVMLDNLPAIAMQGTLAHLGSPGSCEAQSFGYGLGSYTAARNADGSIKWNAELADNQPSAAFLYNWAHNQEGKLCPHGSTSIPYLNRLIAYGAPSTWEIPYYADCTYLNSVTLDPQFPNMTRLRVGSIAGFIIKDDPAAAVILIKKLLAAGRAVAFSGLVLKNYAEPVLTDGVFCSTDTIPKSGHGQLVVGYDDEIGPTGSPGAFLIQNSFGPQWPPASLNSPAPPGRLYWSYQTFMTQSAAATAYPCLTGPLVGTVLTTGGSTLNEPQAAVNRASQWAPQDKTGVWLIALLQFTAPVTLTQVVFTEPGSGTTVSGTYVLNINNGYVYFTRTDGNQFVAGEWGIELSAKDLNGTALEYTGSFTVEVAQPVSPPATPITTSTPITDTLGKPATITPSSHS